MRTNISCPFPRFLYCPEAWTPETCKEGLENLLVGEWGREEQPQCQANKDRWGGSGERLKD